jgi:hypothetical protein
LEVELDTAIASTVVGVAPAATSALVVDAREHDGGWFLWLLRVKVYARCCGVRKDSLLKL